MRILLTSARMLDNRILACKYFVKNFTIQFRAGD